MQSPLDYDASESAVYALGLIEICLSALYGISVRLWFQYYAAVAQSVIATLLVIYLALLRTSGNL